ncbi:glycosyl transferase family 2, partial [Burkholderia multivorans]
HPILPDAEVAEIDGNSWAEKIQSLLEICIEAEADVVIDHHILYNEYWPFYALAAKNAGIGTVGWLHNFALRPIFNGSSRLSFLIANISVLETLVVLSPTDAAFWT